MKILCYDCFSGISGDMNLAALLDLGVPVQYLKDELEKIKIGNYKLQITRQKRNSIEGTMVDVILDESPSVAVLTENRDKGRQRNWKDIQLLISNSNLSSPVKALSLSIFEKIAVAEARIHGVPAEKVHFHEVGAIDSLVDIIGAAICIDYLKPDKIISGAPQLGGGFVKCQHGMIPVPAPATQEILTGIPVKTGLVETETTTPTGAAILATLVNEFCSQLNYRLGKTGYGIGHKELSIPNVLRVFWAESTEDPRPEQHLIIECNIDDMNPEWYEFLMDKLFAAGAEDVFLTPVIMKKSRPGIILSVLCPTALEKNMNRILLTETTTLGLRTRQVNKLGLQREIKTIDTPYGPVRVKVATENGNFLKWKAEYEDCKLLAVKNGLPIREIYAAVDNVLKDQTQLS